MSITRLHEFILQAPPLKVEFALPRTASELLRADLEDLFSGKICALRITNFFDPEVARARTPVLLESFPIENFSLPITEERVQETDVNYSTIGYPKRIGMASEKGKIRYYKEAVPSIRKLREIFAPVISPTDKLRLELDELWSEGAHLSHKEGHTDLASITRIMDPVPVGLIHIDDMWSSVRRKAFSGCIYLQIPDEGGELEVWTLEDSVENQINPLFKTVNTFDLETQKILRERYPEPVRIKPSVGDLILFDSGRPHAVAGFTGRQRVVVQSFIVHEEGKPLIISS